MDPSFQDFEFLDLTDINDAELTHLQSVLYASDPSAKYPELPWVEPVYDDEDEEVEADACPARTSTLNPEVPPYPPVTMYQMMPSVYVNNVTANVSVHHPYMGYHPLYHPDQPPPPQRPGGGGRRPNKGNPKSRGDYRNNEQDAPSSPGPQQYPGPYMHTTYNPYYAGPGGQHMQSAQHATGPPIFLPPMYPPDQMGYQYHPPMYSPVSQAMYNHDAPGKDPNHYQPDKLQNFDYKTQTNEPANQTYMQGGYNNTGMVKDSVPGMYQSKGTTHYATPNNSAETVITHYANKGYDGNSSDDAELKVPNTAGVVPQVSVSARNENNYKDTLLANVVKSGVAAAGEKTCVESKQFSPPEAEVKIAGAVKYVGDVIVSELKSDAQIFRPANRSKIVFETKKEICVSVDIKAPAPVMPKVNNCAVVANEIVHVPRTIAATEAATPLVITPDEPKPIAPSVSAPVCEEVKPPPLVEVQLPLPPSVVDMHLPAPAPAVEAQTVSPAPAIEAQTLALVPAVETQTLALVPAVETHSLSPAPAVETQTLAPTPAIEMQTPAPAPAVEVATPAPAAEVATPAPPPGKSWASLFSASSGRTATDQNAPKKTAIVSPFQSHDGEEAMQTAAQAQRAQKQFDDPQLYRLGEFLCKYELEHKPISLQPRGLTNRSNWCYINSTLQALLACPPFYNLMKSLPLPKRGHKSPTPILDSIVQFVNEFVPLSSVSRVNRKERSTRKDEGSMDVQSGAAFEPAYIYKMLNNIRSDTFKVEGRQEDAEEFLSCLLNALNDEMLEVVKLVQDNTATDSLANGDHAANHSADESSDSEWHVMGPRNKGALTRRAELGRTPVSDIFRGHLRSRVQRAGDQWTDNVQPFFTLQLDIEKAQSVKEALELLVGRDQLEGVTCTKTNQEVEAWQQVTLEDLPLVLVLHLKWFDYKVDGCTKIVKSVEFPIELKVDPKLMSSTKKYGIKAKQYKLFAVVYHDGKEASKGHYVTDAFHVGYGGWVRYDDSNVRAVQEQQVLHPRTPRVPYLLYYRRGDTIGNQTPLR